MSDTNGSPTYKVVVSEALAKQAHELHDVAVEHNLRRRIHRSARSH
jgi:hypothetical protein